jgi:hypothetical protein
LLKSVEHFGSIYSTLQANHSVVPFIFPHKTYSNVCYSIVEIYFLTIVEK